MEINKLSTNGIALKWRRGEPFALSLSKGEFPKLSFHQIGIPWLTLCA